MIEPENDEEFGPYGKSAIKLIDLTFPSLYKFLIIVSPSFVTVGRANIFPQFDRGESFILSIGQKPDPTSCLNVDIKRILPSSSLEESLDGYRYENALLASADLSIITAWAQAEYALLAFKHSLLDHYSEWLQEMQNIGVARKVL